MAEILIGSKLPNGLILHHPAHRSQTVTLKGLNSSKLVGPTYVLTPVDGDFWAAWKAANDHKDRPFGPLKSGAIFESKSESHAGAIAKEQAKRKTGLEPLTTADAEKLGVKKATQD